MSTIKLPPLPDPHCGPNYHTDGFAMFLDDQMQAYATQAVKADRAERQGRLSQNLMTVPKARPGNIQNSMRQVRRNRI